MWTLMLYNAIKSVYLYQAKCICKQLSWPSRVKKSLDNYIFEVWQTENIQILSKIYALLELLKKFLWLNDSMIHYQVKVFKKWQIRTWSNKKYYTLLDSAKPSIKHAW